MGSSVSFFCGSKDTESLTEYATSLGLFLVPLLSDSNQRVSTDTSEYPFCYVSLVPAEQLHPYGDPAIVSNAKDPLIEFLRAYYKAPYLVSGRIYWSTDHKEHAAITKSAYAKLARWVRTNWKKREGHSFYFGPEAEKLIETEGAIPTTFAPNVAIKTIALSP
jgi:hypothetical protein